ncbi:hypothetical protein ACHAXM_005573 [Skeletonema potamos]
MTKRGRLFLLAGAAAAAPVTLAAEESSKNTHRHLRRKLPQKQQQRSLVDNPNNHYCGINWGDAYDKCDTPCPSAKDEECGPGMTCFGFVDCTPPEPVLEPSPSPASSNSTANTPSVNTTSSDNGPTSKVYSELLQQPVPTYIASLPVRPSESVPSTPAPFALPMPTPNSKPNPTNNYCGYGWEGAMKECFHACPSGKDDECPGGRTCHSWMTCTQSKQDPALFNVCGTSWAHAAKTCATRCFQGDDSVCPNGEACFSAVIDCEGKLPELTAVDVGLEEPSFTIEEIQSLLQEELKKEADEEAMNDPMNWWCGTSWSNMLEKCEKRCETDADCTPNSWTEGFCYRTTGGPENCQTPGVPVKEALPPGSSWCGTSWNNMLETCAAQCESDEDCASAGLGQCFQAPGTCQWVGHPVKEKVPAETLWCGSDFDDAQTGCYKACPGATDEECPSGMSCFAESSCTEEGVKVEAAAASAASGYFCGSDWDGAHNCAITCESDADCVKGTNCYWVDECGSSSASVETEEAVDETEEVVDETEEALDEMEGALDEMMAESSEEESMCSPEVYLCRSGEYVARAPELNCDFYPCPGSDEEPASASEETASASEVDTSDEPVAGSGEEVSSDSAPAASESSSAEAGAEQGTVQDFYDALGGIDSIGSDWGTKPLTHACQSGDGDCGMCEGDCDSDDDCLDGLMCFSRGQGEFTAVPGCVSGGDGDKPSMDYCYMEAPPTTTSTTTTTATTTAEAAPAAAVGEWVDEWVDDSSPGGELYHTRECSIALKCSECEGDCDMDSHCMDGLKCFSRDDGSVNAVPGCNGLGTPGMDYCFNPNSPSIQPIPSSTGDATADPSPQSSGCSAEVRTCPGGMIIYQDPNNNCEFPPCEESEIVSSVMSDSSFCGFSLDRVNGDCDNAKPCPSGDSGECDGLEVCIQNTICGSHRPTTTTSTAVATVATESCDNLCLTIPPQGQEFCPTDPNLPNCLEVSINEFCESDGECGTSDKLDNCDGTFDIYFRVECGGTQLSQGQIMRATGAPTSSPSLAPTTAKPTASPTTSSPSTSPATNQPLEAVSMQMDSAAGGEGNATDTQPLSSQQSSTNVGPMQMDSAAGGEGNATDIQPLSSPQSSTNVELGASYGNITQTAFTAGFSFDRSPEQNNTETTADVTANNPSASETNGMYWTNPSTEYKWDFASLSDRSSQPLPYGKRLSLLVGLSSIIAFAVEHFI